MFIYYVELKIIIHVYVCYLENKLYLIYVYFVTERNSFILRNWLSEEYARHNTSFEIINTHLHNIIINVSI